MAGMHGAETDGLRRVARRFGITADAVERASLLTTGQVARVEWVGRDADDFRSGPVEAVRAGLDHLGALLRDRDAELVRQAAAQDEASSARGPGTALPIDGHGDSAAAPGTEGPVPSESIDVDHLQRIAGDPDAVANFLDGVSDQALERLAFTRPDLLGPLEGAPYWARDLANQERLDEALQSAREHGGGQLDGLEQVRRVLDTTPDATLPHLDLTDRGRVYAAVGVGDLDAAGNVTYLVHGINNSVEGQLPAQVESAMNLRDQIALAGTGDVRDVATVAWMGYDSGGMLSVRSDGLAVAGAERLSATLDGFTAARPDDTVDLGVVGHSYGSTAAGLALSDGSQHGVDRFVSMGSAGFVEARDTNGWWPGGKEISRSDFGSTEVYVTEASPDHTADIGRFVSGRLDPRDHGFTEFSADAADGRPGTTGHGHGSSGSDVGYLGPGSNSLYNIGQILTGQYGAVDPGR
ncbi:alpha/beta hydrolase [Pseudoclavibacter endophyticus]|uniref:DUF1023 domain-containing protein n=1 Tax=Pseudoclavibacter endophyticus TaxID=1778590 RepID=A0A6H9WSJ3_9MICO|nr:alpha/beta hydrolase [Pseudoclavibacter endophyticus]KAB1649304.1 hypothetical protein F8O04_03255 [Pseudoclavibacter endophyticus]